ncbi:MAG: hypothetical protein D6800_01070 [Candidatus Zixiibacteriota bacterium]|nr:MAG: hypothetical protein D6800_01070 [candidate division Zixibacteria bacterium]
MNKDEQEYTAAPNDVARALAEGKEIPWSKIERMLEMPTPNELAAGLRTKKTSISLTELTIEKFKDAAKKENVPYQQLIREVLHWYAQNYLDNTSDAA